MKHLILLFSLFATACTTHITLDSIEPANSASVFCHKQGGTAVARRNQQGGYDNLCRLPDGTMVDEQEYYRRHKPQ